MGEHNVYSTPALVGFLLGHCVCSQYILSKTEFTVVAKRTYDARKVAGLFNFTKISLVVTEMACVLVSGSLKKIMSFNCKQ